MNSVIREYYDVFELYQALRSQLMVLLNDEDLLFRPGGDNPTLGELCREIGEVEQCYIESFKSFTQDFDLRIEDSTLQESVARLTEWYQQLDDELKEVISGLTEEELQNRMIDRGGGFVLPPRIQLEVYKEALLIFYGKVSVYLKALEKDLPAQWQQWIA